MQKGFILFLFLFWGLAPQVWGQFNFSSLISPGKLAKPHSSFEGLRNCNLCHATAKGVPDQKCLACHKEILRTLSKSKSFHGRQKKACVACHGDHKGLTYDLTGLSRLLFSHQDTPWPLTGKHKNVPCEKCHPQKRLDVATQQRTQKTTFLEAKSSCVSCHENVHNSNTKEMSKCENCHSTSSWSVLRDPLLFDHNRATPYNLTGAHKKVRCVSCHKQKKWPIASYSSCQTCHADPHQGKYQQKCETCHTTSSWKTTSGVEARVSGTTPSGKVSIPKPSLTKGLELRKINTKKFNHNATAYPLKGAHRTTACSKCHGSIVKKIPQFNRCETCHPNPHGNQFQVLWSVSKTCADCHVEDRWSKITLNHSKDTRFPLEEKHLQVPCKNCHTKGRYRFLREPALCSNCHEDVHKGKYQKPCNACHNQRSFKEVAKESTTIDHNRQTRFPLVGKHVQVPCKDCHPGNVYRGADRTCQGCHEDFHKGELGKECVRCHSPTSFKDIEFDHNRGSRFRLEGKHREVKCNQCHPQWKYKLSSTQCVDCHRDVHGGKFGTQCDQCHSVQGFVVQPGYHEFGEFSLTGAHKQLVCSECHDQKTRIRLGASLCASCHKNPHLNSLGKDCYLCHNQISWVPSTFRHNQTGFELSGAHRFLACDQCHWNRVFGGLPQDCIFCHQKDLPTTVGTVNHNDLAAIQECDRCHYSFAWNPPRKK